MQDLQKGKLKTIDFTKDKEFTANGTKYFVEGSLSFERFLWYQKLQLEFAYEPGFYGILQALRKGYDLCNEQKFADLAVLLHNTMAGVKTVDNRKIPALDLCCLFINTEDEDRTVISDEMLTKKQKDWEAEGLDIMPFFLLAIDSVKDYRKGYNELTLSSSE